MNYIAKLADTRTLWISFVSTLVITATFQIVIAPSDLVLLDPLSDPDQVRLAIAGMSDQQRILHAWITATLDVAYPIAYGALFIGSAVRFFPSRGLLFALPGMICIPIDLIEGVVQVLALVGNVDWTQSKALLTPVKLLLAVTGALITISGWLKWSINRLRRAA
jgi:hypothetical protein